MSVSQTTLTPEQITILRNLGQMQPQAPTGVGPTGPPPTMGGGAPQMPRFQPSPQGAMLPTGTAVPTPRGVPPTAAPPRQPQQISGRGVIGSVIAGIAAAKQGAGQKKQTEARNVVGAWIALKQSGDPAMSAQADELMQKHLKIFEKAADPVKGPNSPEYAGLQQAYRDVMQQDAAKQEFQKMQAQIQQQIALAQQEQSRAKYYEQHGQVTPEDQYKEGQKNVRLFEQLQVRQTTAKAQIKAQADRTDKTIASLEKRAEAREAGLDKRAKARNAMQANAAKSMLGQWRNLQAQYNTLTKQQTDLEKNQAAHPVEEWIFGDSDMYNAQQAQIEARKQELDSQMAQLQLQMSGMQASGVLSNVATDVDIPAPVEPANTDTTKPSAGAAKPIVVTKDDMK